VLYDQRTTLEKEEQYPSSGHHHPASSSSKDSTIKESAETTSSMDVGEILLQGVSKTWPNIPTYASKSIQKRLDIGNYLYKICNHGCQ